MTKKIKNQRSLFFLFVLPICMLIIVLGGTYALNKVIIKGEEKVFLEVGEFKVHFVDSDVINLNNATPLPDEVGMNLPGYSFTVKNTGTLDANYQLSLEQSEVSPATLNQNYIRYSVKIDEEEWSEPILLSELNNLMITSFSSLAPEAERNYEIKLWLDEHADNEAQGKVFEARLVLDAVQDSFILPDTTPPEIRLNGETVMNIKQHTPFVDPGISSVTDDRDKLERDKIETTYYYLQQDALIEVDSIDTSLLGVYYIHYSISDTSGNKGLVIRTVNIYLPDTTPPEISLIGEDIINIEQYDDYIEPGVEAIDNIDGDITHRVVTIGTVNTTLVGSYPIKYIITDQAGNTSSISRVVNVEEVIYVLPARFGQTVEMHNFWNDMRALNPREIIFQQGVGPSESLREEFDRYNKQFLANNILSETEYEELWDVFLSRRFRRVKAPLSEGYVETYVVIAEDNIPRHYIQTRSGKMHSPVNSNQLFASHDQLRKILNIETLDTRLTTTMWGTFRANPLLKELNLDQFDTSNVTNMGDMFNLNSELEKLNVDNWDTSNVTNMSFMFRNNRSLTELDLSSFDTSKVTTMESMFARMISLNHLDISNFNTSNVTTMRAMFYNEQANNRSTMRVLNLSHFDTRNVVDMDLMFFEANHLTNIGISNFDTSEVMLMNSMFAGASSLGSLDLSGFDTKNVTDMAYMFWNTTSLTSLDLSGFDTRNVTDMSFMFRNSRSLTELDLSSFDTNKVTTMESMFARMISLNHLDISNFNTSNVMTMRAMFYNEQANNRSTMRVLNLSHFDTRNVVDMEGMFFEANHLTNIDISSFDTRNVTTKIAMFTNTTNLNEVLVNRNTWKTTDVVTTNMWTGSKINSVTFK